MMRRVVESVRAIEHAATRGGKSALRRTTVNGRSEMLPEDPHEVVRILAERRQKSPAMDLKARLLADLRKRG
ncbi:hypothetical protein EJV44_12260 [Ancylobacter aquaticus]|nr:hypothetical protein EJV44_12260 [Ancylobacter aquaticus]